MLQFRKRQYAQINCRVYVFFAELTIYFENKKLKNKKIFVILNKTIAF